MISRRGVLVGAATVAAAGLQVLPVLPARATERSEKLRRRLASLEQRHGGRLGVAIQADDRQIAHRGDERFALCSTFKCAAAAFVLSRVDRGRESLARRIPFTMGDLVPYSPATMAHAGGPGLTVGALCEAAVTLSDNTAANLLLDSFGGPPELTAFLRWTGDKVTRLDRREPELNEATPGDPRDTTTPLAMLEFLRKVVLGTVLSPAAREQLTTWLVATKTGDKRLRAGLPPSWRVGDKTGTGGHNTTNDCAVIWPRDRAPIVVAAYYAESRGSLEEREAILAEVGRLAAAV